MRSLGALLLLVSAFALTTGITDSQEKKEPKKQNQLPVNWGKLGLSDQQKRDIYKVQDIYSVKIDELTNKINDLKVERQREMVKILTPDQKKKLSELTIGDPPEPEKK
jgi:hypothetical protein